MSTFLSPVTGNTGFCWGRSGGKLSRPFSQAVTAIAISSSDRVASSSSSGSLVTALSGAGLGLLLEVRLESQDTLLFQYSLCSSLTWLLSTQCLEPAVQGTQLLREVGRILQ